ncbi:MAG: N-acetyltransferase family protein [Granulosicoccus sp.]
MSALIRPAVSNDIEPICSLLHEKMNSKIPVSRWRQLMSYRWLDEKPDFGRVVESSGKILGFCGMVYADRLLGDVTQEQGLRHERIVSMSSWYLDKSLRGQGLGRDMLLSAIDDPSLTYATLTNSRKPLAIVEGLGFRKLEDRRYVWRKTGVADTNIVLIRDPVMLRTRVESHQRQLLDDMSDLPLVPLLLEYHDRQALLFFSIKSKGENVLWFDLMYASDQTLFVECAQALANVLLPDTPAVLASDGRFVRQAPADVEAEPLPVARYYISNSVAPHELDNLYSELQLLDLKLD